MRKVAIYARVSTDEQARVEEGSTKNQGLAARRYVDGENIKASGHWGSVVDTYVDEGFSGSNLERPQLRKLLLDISRRKIDLVIITELSRLSRSRRDWIDLLQFFKDHDVSFVSLRQQVDTSTAVGRLLLNLLIDFAELELAQISERVTASYYERACRGLWTGGVPPYGLETTERNGHLKVNAAKRIVADEILNILIDHAGYLSKATQMIEEAGYGREGDSTWSFQTLANWIRSRAVVGEVEVNGKNRDKVQEHLTEGQRYKVVKAVWEPLVDRAKWQRANELLDANYRKLKVAQWKHHEFILSGGLLECEHARPLSGTSGTGKTKGKYIHYRHGKADIGRCSCGLGRISAPKIEAKVVAEVKRLSRRPEVVKELVKKANEDFVKQRPDNGRTILEHRRRVGELERKLQQITDQVLEADSKEDKAMWLDKARQCRSQKDSLDRELKVLVQESESHQAAALDPKTIMDALTRFGDDFDSLPVASRRSVLNALLEKIVVMKDRIKLVVRGVPPGAMDSIGRSQLEGCYPGGRNSAHLKGWLARHWSFRTRLSSPSTY